MVRRSAQTQICVCLMRWWERDAAVAMMSGGREEGEEMQSTCSPHAALGRSLAEPHHNVVTRHSSYKSSPPPDSIETLLPIIWTTRRSQPSSPTTNRGCLVASVMLKPDGTEINGSNGTTATHGTLRPAVPAAITLYYGRWRTCFDCVTI